MGRGKTLHSRDVTASHSRPNNGSQIEPVALTHQKKMRLLGQRHDLTPIIYIKATTIQNVPLDRALIALCDPGSTGTMINTTSFPYGVVPTQGPPKRTTTPNGTFDTNENGTICNIKFPEFANKSIGNVQADVFTQRACRYDVILGRTELRKMGMIFNFTNNTISWFEQTIPMKATRSMLALPDSMMIQEEMEDAEIFTSDILERKYQSVTPQEVVDTLTHLELSKRLRLKIVLEKYKDVFNGQLGCHPTAKVRIRLKHNAIPIWQKPYSVPFARREAFKRELKSMIRDGVLVQV